MDQNFDSVLHSARGDKPAELIIRLRVALNPYPPSGPRTSPGQLPTGGVATGPGGVSKGTVQDSDGRPFNCITWTEAGFNAFAIKFKKMVELSWNNQLVLLPPEGTGYLGAMNDQIYREFIGRPTIPAHVVCSMDIQLWDVIHLKQVGRGPHAVIDVVLLDQPVLGEFRSNQSLITNKDVEFGNTRGSLRQVTAAHEVGHWLGSPVTATDVRRYLPHVDAQEGTDRNDSDEYGRTLGKRMALMGSGQLLTDFETTPWLDRVRLHTGALMGWDIVHRVHMHLVPVSARQRTLLGAAKPNLPAQGQPRRP